jgi:transketolase
MEEDIKRIQDKANELRDMTLKMCVSAGTGHVTSSFSCAEILATLYHGNILKHNFSDPSWKDRDRFILSKGQASPILYVALADAGYFPKNWLETFCKKDGKFGVHLQNNIPGVEISAGSLGHGLGIAAGMALAAKMDKEHYFTFVLLGDGELYEGSNWESAMFASSNHLNNLIAIVDRNGQCATDFTEDSVKLNPIDEKFRAFGWDVKTIDGHSIPQILEALKGFRSEKRDKPYLIIAETIKGKGSPYIESQILWHARAPVGEEVDIVKKELEDSRGRYPDECRF